MLRTLLIRTLLVGLAIGLWFVASPGHAATRTWDGGTGVGDGSNWNTPANWIGDVAPVPGADDLVFAGANDTATSNNFAAGSQFNGITFDAGASSFTATGNSMVLGGNIVNNSPNAQSMSLPIVLGGLSTTAINGASQFVTNAGAGTLALSGLSRTALSGQAAMFTTGGGTVNTSLANGASGILGAWATIGNGANDWAANDGSGNVVAYTGYTDITGAAVIASAPTANYRWSSSVTPATLAAAGTTDINSLQFTDSTAATITFAGGSTLRVGPAGGISKTANTAAANALTIGAAGGVITAGGADNSAGELVLHGNATTPDLNGIIVPAAVNDNGTGVVTVIKTGNAAVQFNVANNYSGGSYIQSGRLRGQNVGSFGSGPIYVASGAQAYLNIGANAMANNFFIGGKGFLEGSPQFSGGAVRLANGGSTISGTVTLLSDARITARGAGATGGVVTGKITGGFGVDFSGANVGAVQVLRLANPANDWTGNTTMFNGTLRLDANEVIPHGAGKGNMVIFGEPSSTTLSTLDLNAKTETINGLSATTVADGGDPTKAIITNNLAGTATLKVGDNNASGDFGGVIQSGTASPTTMITAVTKIGSGTQILSGTNSYTGPTRVEGGTLSNTSAFLDDFADVFVSSGAFLNLNFSGPDTIKSLFLGGMPAAVGTWGGAGSGATNITPRLTGTGILDVTMLGVLPILVGDYNGNNAVDAADYVQWREAQSTGATTLTNRDPVNSGVVGDGDYNSWRKNFGNTLPGSASGITQVPEPGAAVLVLLAAAAVSTRIRSRRPAAM